MYDQVLNSPTPSCGGEAPQRRQQLRKNVQTFSEQDLLKIGGGIGGCLAQKGTIGSGLLNPANGGGYGGNTGNHKR